MVCIVFECLLWWGRYKNQIERVIHSLCSPLCMIPCGSGFVHCQRFFGFSFDAIFNSYFKDYFSRSTPNSPARGSGLRARTSQSQEPPRTNGNFARHSFGKQTASDASVSSKFAITTNNRAGIATQQRDTLGVNTTPSVVYHNNAIYSPMPSIGGRGSDPSIALFMVEVKLLSDDQPPFQLEVHVSSPVLDIFLNRSKR